MTTNDEIDPSAFRQCAHAPADGRIVSPFGMRASIQDRGVRRHHQGLDIAGAIGAPVYAVADGLVEAATPNGAPGFSCYGHVIVIHHPQWGEDRTFYAHLSALHVTPGQRVSMGDRIADIGNTNGTTRSPGTTFAQGSCQSGRTPPFLASLAGRSGPHLHFEASPHSYPQPYEAPRYQPQLWLADRGITYDDQGRLLVAESCTEPHEDPSAELGPTPSDPYSAATSSSPAHDGLTTRAAGGVLVPAVAIGGAVGLAHRYLRSSRRR